MDVLLSNLTVSVTELKQNFASILKEAQESPVAILNHNRPEAYLLSESYYKSLIELIEDFEDTKKINERKNGPFIDVDINDL
jgi:antitoxin StbD